uniref:Metalloendopeptidase n=1 Tax=Ceriantheomorphe brasiliensis TaxID=1048506 RepID=A0A7G7WYQ9_9CNID|nr:toxin candidate TRINITY_DN13930_c0_g1_i1 [Ceriantheomorphe brasiliensis]
MYRKTLFLLILLLFITGCCNFKLDVTDDLRTRLLAYGKEENVRRDQPHFDNEASDEAGMTEVEKEEEIEAEEEHRGYIEGDILPDMEIIALEEGMIKRDSLALKNRLWPGGIVPYVFDNSMTSKGKQAVLEAIDAYLRQTCIRFIPKRPYDSHFVRFYRGRGCFSKLGRAPQPGGQPLSVGSHCEWKGTMIHEMMHAIGFFHEQSRQDRDKFVRINNENIKPGMENNFKKYSHGVMDNLGAPYDYDSIMHYPSTAFSKNGKDTMVPLLPGGKHIGQRKGFSEIDLQQIHDLYCKPPPTTQPPTTFPCIDLGTKCKIWKKRGRCEIDKHLPKMKERCAKTCGHC